MSQLPSDPTLAPSEGSRDDRAAALSAQSAASAAPAASTTAPIHTPNRRRQSQRGRAKATASATASAKNSVDQKDGKEPASAPGATGETTTATPNAHDADQSVNQGAEATATPTTRRGRNANRRANASEKPGRVAKANKTAPLGKASQPKTVAAPATATEAANAQPAPTSQPTNASDGDAQSAQQEAGAPLIVPVTTQEAHAGRAGRGARRGGRDRDHHDHQAATHEAETTTGAAASTTEATPLTITMEQGPAAEGATAGAEAQAEQATTPPVEAQAAQPEAPRSRYRFDRRSRGAPQPSGFGQPREERLSGLYTTPTISPTATTSAPAAPTAPEVVATLAPSAETSGAGIVAPETTAPETSAAQASSEAAATSAAPVEGRPRRFGAPRRIRVEPIGAAPATAAPVASAAPEAAPEPAAEASAPAFDQADQTDANSALEANEAPTEFVGDETHAADEEEAAEAAAPTRGTSSRRSSRRRRRKSSARANADTEADERDADMAPEENYEDATDAYASAPDEAPVNGYAPDYRQGYGPGVYAPNYGQGYGQDYGRDYNAEYGEFAGPESYGEPYAPAPFTPAPYTPPPAPPSFAPAPYTPGGRAPSGQNAGQWQGNTPRGVAPTSGRNNTQAPTSASPYSSPEPAFARGFGPLPSGVASSTRDQYAPPYTRNGRNGERNGESALLTSQVNAAIRDAKESFQQQTDRLLSEMRRNVAPPTMTVAFPAMPSTERVGVFVDVANVLYSARNQRITVDFGRLLEFLRGNRRLIRAHAYAPTSPEPSADQSFLTAVKGLGYRITTKNYKTFASGAKKADLDLDLCMDIVRLVEAKALDTIALVSGDSDFLPVLEYCSDHGVRVEVAAFEDSAAMILRQSCDVFINLSMLDEIRN